MVGTFSSCSKPSSNQGSSDNKSLNKSQIEIIQATNPEKLPQVARDRKDTLIVGTTAPNGTFNPIYSGSLYDSWVCSLIFDGLISNDAEGNPIPNVAEKWDISEDGKTYTFYIKKELNSMMERNLQLKTLPSPSQLSAILIMMVQEQMLLCI
ncbi:hypothetical protein [Caloramator sp. Dgby_cultured_2]|uniref:hypothetical protein n=1 Tax=Caloramator sp. Dgby_cultured_2 TaxID=3029174 RepID=UPI00237E49EA|nr:hypothetical protein [Caloramator sp. Dgby_cultured_2]WDU83180.1 hypothetical protein PWK10_17885 [Caloramator sp. Dgby_cultured_2]